MEVIFATGVLEEVAEAQNYYESEVEGLGKVFMQILFDSIQGIKRYPEASRIISKPTGASSQRGSRMG